ncbi:MAG: mannitol-1-phosphate 5-dehydrogenase [Gorillibacterium sp.]|nr:mannitol-1-phosphate 5-dehydrogenase [Gorillibacterium sp.]
MKAVHFGAGNIGRGFIGLLLSKAGYRVVFSDVNETLVKLLQEQGHYTVELANDAKDTIEVDNVTAINGRDLDAVAREVAEADLVTTAVGVSVLPHIAEGIARGVALRLQAGGGTLTFIACENAIGGTSILKKHVLEKLPEALRTQAEEVMAFPDAAVDRIVPIQHHENDPLRVKVEPFYEWVVDRSQMKQQADHIEGIHYVDNLEPFIERKLFTVNTGHCTVAYLGYLRGYETIQQAMADEAVVKEAQAVLEETGAVLVKKFSLDKTEHEAYIHKILGRFRNSNLTDEVTRVGRSPIRKISPNDRLVRPAMQAYENGLSARQLAKIIAAALLFNVADDPESVELQAAVRDLGAAATVTKYTGIAASHPLHVEIMSAYQGLAKD